VWGKGKLENMEKKKCRDCKREYKGKDCWSCAGFVENTPNAGRLTEALRRITIGIAPKKN